jgi:beta-galactosidase
LCPTATNQLKCRVKGNGTYRAACNGDATSLELFYLPTMKLFSGKLVVLIKSINTVENIELSVSGKRIERGDFNSSSTN